MANQYGLYIYEEDCIRRGDFILYVADLVDYYITTNHSAKETAAHFSIPVGQITRFMNHYGLAKPRALSHEINKITCLERYGDPTYNNQEKLKQTNLEKYGCENVYQAESIKQKCEETKLARYGNAHFTNVPKQQQTNLERYGVSNTMKLPEVQEKAKQTCLEHFGVEYPMQSEAIRAKYNFEELSAKAFATKKINGTTNSSKIQKWFISELKEIYGNEQIEEEYNKDPRYPYHCDVYIKSLDQFIELNIYFTHGSHPFNINSLEDLQLLEEWKMKSETSNFFKNAIKVWTVSDPEKQLCAQKNNLNYLTLYTADEAINYINTLKEKNND